MMVIPACEFKACLDSDRTITSRTSINLAKILIYKILPNTTYNLLELLFYYDTWGITNTNLSSRIPDFFGHPSPPHHLQLSQSQSHQRLDTGTPTEDMFRSHRLPWRCLPVSGGFRGGLEVVSSSENPSENQTVRLFFGGREKLNTQCS